MGSPDSELQYLGKLSRQLSKQIVDGTTSGADAGEHAGILNRALLQMCLSIRLICKHYRYSSQFPSSCTVAIVACGWSVLERGRRVPKPAFFVFYNPEYRGSVLVAPKVLFQDFDIVNKVLESSPNLIQCFAVLL